MNKCKIDGCEGKYHGLGYCDKHYQRYKTHGDPLCTHKVLHGMRGTPEYRSWVGMKKRCSNKKYKSYHRYGGRGIKVCKRWVESFLAFYEDMGDKPFSAAQIDRKNNDKGYYKSNCRWTTCAINNQNRSDTVLNWFTVRSVRRLFAMHKYTNRELCLIYNLNPSTIKNVVYNTSWKE